MVPKVLGLRVHSSVRGKRQRQRDKRKGKAELNPRPTGAARSWMAALEKHSVASSISCTEPMSWWEVSAVQRPGTLNIDWGGGRMGSLMATSIQRETNTSFSHRVQIRNRCRQAPSATVIPESPRKKHLRREGS
jgi:hypothetical protein